MLALEPERKTLLPILQSLPEGSSGTGVSHYTTPSVCSRKANLDKLLPPRPGGFSGNLAMDVGKVFHALAEIYFSCGNSNIAIELEDSNLGGASAEARRLFQAYAQRFAPSDFLRVVATELLLPSSPEQEALVATAVGVSPFTVRIDLVVEVDADSAETLYKKRNIIVEPGVYLWDYKTSGNKGESDELFYRHSTQFTAYQVVWNALFPHMPCKGMVADRIITGIRSGKTRQRDLEDGDFYSIVVPAPTETQTLGFKRWLKSAKEASLRDEPNWTACFDDFKKPCQHLTSGACTRA